MAAGELPERNGDGYFNSVSCPTTTACTAVGDWDRTGAHPVFYNLVEQSDQNTWAVRTVPDASKTTNNLLGVSCPGLQFCMAVGVYQNPGTGIHRASGDHQGSQSHVLDLSGAVIPAGGRENALTAVSCLSATQCVVQLGS
jgi:hypothetical protein